MHYELPRDTESFLHRSGRTARAGRSGTTIAIFTRRELASLKRIAREVGVSSFPPASSMVREATLLRASDHSESD